jgi:tetratricopeptide (TPR) repeat protein
MSLQRLWRVGLCLPILSSGILHSLPARAAPSTRQPESRRPAEFQTYLQAAIRLYDKLDYEQALKKLASARRYTHDQDDDVLVFLYEGLVLADMNRTEQAKAAFRAGLLLKPEAKLPTKVSPKVEQDFEAVRADIRRQQTPQAETHVVTAPPEPPKLEQVEPVDARRPVLTPIAHEPARTAAPIAPFRELSYGLLGGGAARLQGDQDVRRERL